MEYSVSTYSGKGGRDYNEDTVFAQKTEYGIIAIVADGLGMHGGGEIASDVAVRTLSGLFLEHPDTSAAYIDSCFDAANRAVLDNQTPERQMKTTAVMLVCKDSRAYIAHVGDSRCYFFRNGKTSYLTSDHSLPQLEVLRGDITADEIRFHPDRNKLFRALGGNKTIRADIAAPDTLLCAGDAFLLCSDGFWEYVTEEEMEIELAKASTPEEWLSGLLYRIGRSVAGDNDNLSAVAVIAAGG